MLHTVPNPTAGWLAEILEFALRAVTSSMIRMEAHIAGLVYFQYLASDTNRGHEPLTV